MGKYLLPLVPAKHMSKPNDRAGKGMISPNFESVLLILYLTLLTLLLLMSESRLSKNRKVFISPFGEL